MGKTLLKVIKFISVFDSISLKVNFDASASSDPDGDELTYKWDFGDGTQANGAEVSHIYKEGGRYKVILTVQDNSGALCNKSSDSLKVTVNAPPVPVIKVK